MKSEYITKFSIIFILLIGICILRSIYILLIAIIGVQVLVLVFGFFDMLIIAIIGVQVLVFDGLVVFGSISLVASSCLTSS